MSTLPHSHSLPLGTAGLSESSALAATPSVVSSPFVVRPADPTRPRPRVLLAEDNPTTRKLMSVWLESSGYTVVQAENGSIAWDAAQYDCPPIVVTDWNMPQMSGLDLCKYIRQAHDPDKVYLLIATSRDEGGDLHEAMEAGANDFLSKPIRQDEFLARIQNAENSLRELQNRRAMADSDPLTGLLNRRAFLAQAQRVLEDSRSQLTAVSCVMLDVDQFKKYNDDYGHAVGDEVLRIVADCLRRETRESDLSCRLGGDEFCVLLSGASENDAYEIAERIRQRIAQQSAQLQQQSLAIHSTLSVTAWAPNVETIEELLDITDRVLLIGKADGRNRTVRHSDLQRGRADSSDAQMRPERRLLETTAVERIVKHPITVLGDDEPWLNARQIYLNNEIDFICVVNRAGELVGAITERELLNAVIHGQPQDATVRAIMSYNFVSYSLKDPLIKVWETFHRTPMMRKIVVDPANHPIGQLDIKSLVELLLAVGNQAS